MALLILSAEHYYFFFFENHCNNFRAKNVKMMKTLRSNFLTAVKFVACLLVVHDLTAY